MIVFCGSDGRPECKIEIALGSMGWNKPTVLVFLTDHRLHYPNLVPRCLFCWWAIWRRDWQLPKSYCVAVFIQEFPSVFIGGARFLKRGRFKKIVRIFPGNFIDFFRQVSSQSISNHFPQREVIRNPPNPLAPPMVLYCQLPLTLTTSNVALAGYVEEAGEQKGIFPLWF
jgi:hypothetical protein